jgi:2-polyprenyl-3-methyl-5-hydroxy-6-metoxy-1,4-benzoquinol methylase
MSDLNIYDNLIPLIRKKGKIQDPEKFQRRVNEIFHNIESASYDGFHKDMWDSLAPVFDKLAEKAAETDFFSSGSDLHLLDIGCGTGLSTELLLRTKISEKIGEITLLDSSPGMIEVSKKRSEKWNKKVNFINGYIEKVPPLKYDIILCSSVLHHIPDLKSFFAVLANLQSPGGIFIHLQDPDGDSLKSKAYTDRLAQLRQYRESHRKRKSLFSKLYNFKRKVFREDFNNRVNAELISQGVTRKKLTDKELWSVTDIRVEGLPYSTNEGITISFLKNCLGSYRLLYNTTYAFFGELSSYLPEAFKEKEAELFSAKSIEGRLLAGIWVKY